MYRVLSFCVLLATWLVLSGLIDWFHVSLGIISCALVTWWSSDMLFSDRSIAPRARLLQFCRLPGYLLWLLWQIFLANLHVLRLAFSPRLREEIEPQLVRFSSGLNTNFQKFVLAQSITLTPGTVTLRIEGDEFVVHAISNSAARGLTGPMTERVRHVFCDSQQ
ncbi:MAG: Na+/H+ antiporter subunit E [Verrucomicrobiales bacterium]